MTEQQLSNKDYLDFCRKLEKLSGIVLGESKEYLVISRLRQLMQINSIETLPELMLLMDRDNNVQQEAINAMTTNETLWFRDDHPFKIFNEQLLPEFAKSSSTVRIWSAASSTGQEPYSLAIQIAEEKRNNNTNSNVRVEILATDLSTEVIETAKIGIYPMLALKRGMSEELLERYFDPVDGNKWQIKEEIRRMVTFKQLNLQESFSSLGKFDVVFCRNVLIYFSQEFKKDILTRIHEVLKDEGVLFVGASESISQVGELFQMEHCSPGIVYLKK